MTREWTDLELLHELQPVVEKLINRHFSMAKDWNPHDYIPWSEGKNHLGLRRGVCWSAPPHTPTSCISAS